MSESLEDNNRALAPLAKRKHDKVEEVIETLQEIRDVADRLPGDGKGHRDGIGCFSELYRQITSDVLAAYEAGSLFSRGPFIIQLDLAFAQRYLDALNDHLDGGSPAPGCWELLFDRRQQDHAPWRFAAVGVNAHVNFDLAFALLDVWEDNPTPLATTSAQFADYQAINTIFHRRMDMLCEEFDAPWTLIGGDGSIFDRAGNILGDLLVVGTRDIAWTFAERMWRHRDEGDYRTVPTATLDTIATGFAAALI